MKKGYTLVELLVSLFFISFIVITSLSLIRILIKREFAPLDQNDVFTIQLRKLLISAEEFRLEAEKLCFYYLGNDYCLVEDRNRIIKEGGYEILMMDVTSVSFSLSDTSVRINYRYQGVDYAIEEAIK